MFEKERQRCDLHIFWGVEDNTQRKLEKEQQSVFVNCLAGNSEELSPKKQYETSDFKGEGFCNDIERDKNSPKDIKEDFDTVPKEIEFYDDLDETDFFDSEDEYWERNKNKKIEDNPAVCEYCLSYHLPRSVHEDKSCKSTVCNYFFLINFVKHIFSSIGTRRAKKNKTISALKIFSKKLFNY